MQMKIEHQLFGSVYVYLCTYHELAHMRMYVHVYLCAYVEVCILHLAYLCICA